MYVFLGTLFCFFFSNFYIWLFVYDKARYIKKKLTKAKAAGGLSLPYFQN